MEKKYKILRDHKGAMSIFMLAVLSILVMSGMSLYEVQLASAKDVHYSHSMANARFLAQSALQQARYYAVKVDPSFAGTSTEQALDAGTFEYSISRNVAKRRYYITGTGYVPNKTAKDKVQFTFASDFRHSPIPIGVVVLDPTMSGALSITGNGTLTITASDGRVIVNSNNKSAATVSGNAELITPEMDITGKYTLSGNGKITGDVQTGQPPWPDPLAFLPEPLQADYTQIASTKTTLTDKGTSKAPHVINPGVYVGGLHVKGNSYVQMQPGLYYMKGAASGGGFMIEGNTTLVGTGITIYNDPTSSTQDFDFNTNDPIEIYPPEEGDFAGVLLYQRRTSTTAVSITGNSGTKITGAFYMRDAKLSLSGNATSKAMGTAYVVDSMSMSGNGDISIIELPDD